MDKPTLSLSECLKIREKYLHQSYHSALKQIWNQPVYIKSGKMQYVFDENDKKYLDLVAGICTVSCGHSNPRINEVLKNQADKIWHCTNIFVHENVHIYAEKLIKKFPENSGLKKVFFVNSGSEANDLALLMAKKFTKRQETMSLSNSYHGMTVGVQSLNGLSTWRENVAKIGGHCFVQQPKNFCKKEYDESFDNCLKYQVGRSCLAGFWVECIQGVGGTVCFPEGWLKNCAEKVKKMGGLVICDEVQTGFGRTGESFWGFEGEGFTPDIVVLAKGIANGLFLNVIRIVPPMCIEKEDVEFAVGVIDEAVREFSHS